MKGWNFWPLPIWIALIYLSVVRKKKFIFIQLCIKFVRFNSKLDLNFHVVFHMGPWESKSAMRTTQNVKFLFTNNNLKQKNESLLAFDAAIQLNEWMEFLVGWMESERFEMNSTEYESRKYLTCVIYLTYLEMYIYFDNRLHK